MDMQAQNNNFRIPNMIDYPELNKYKKHQLYDGFIGCGGLFLFSKMAKLMNLKKGDVVLDLGCGLGSASIFLAQHFEVTIIAVDLWHSPELLNDRIKNKKLIGKIIPLQCDMTKSMPFTDHYFDVIFSMNALFMFGNTEEFLSRLLNLLKPNGIFCLGSECFNQEPDNKTTQMFNFNWTWDVWEDCFSKYHSPKWWKTLFERTDKLRIDYCQEMADSIILWEDLAINYENYFRNLPNKDVMIPQRKVIELVEYGKYNTICLSLFILCGVRNEI